MIDFWYPEDDNINEISDVTAITYNFYPNEGVYRGNVYHMSRAIGDFEAKSSMEIEKMFPHLKINWGY